MKKLILVLIVAAIGYFVYTSLTRPLSEEETAVKAIEKQFADAYNQYFYALRQMGGLGMDATSEADTAVEKMKKAEKDLLALKKSLSESKAMERAEKLKSRIETIFQKNNIK